MKTASFTTMILSALAFAKSSLANSRSSGDLRGFATELGLSGTDVDALVDSYGGSSSKHVRDLSCQVLGLLFPDNTDLPNEPAYEAKIAKNWSTRAWLNATCVFSPGSTESTAIGVRVANFFDTQFAIRSGGHSPDPNIASTADGILFSLENLNQVSLDTSKNIASIGPGNKWGQVYEQLGAKGYVVLGGRVPDVGVGGFLTGGGLSYFSGTEGFAVNTVQNYEVVLGDGCVVNANANENSELWWALKGGGNNFGIVTRFDIKAIPKDNGLIWGGVLYFLPYQYPGVIAAITKFQAEGQVTDPKAAIIVSFINAPAVATELVEVVVFHQDPRSTAPSSLQHFFDLSPIQNTTTTKTLSALAADAYGDAASAPPARQLFRDLSIGVSDDLYTFAINLFNETYDPLKDAILGVQYVLTCQPISVAMVDASNSTGGDPLGVPRKPHTWLLISTSWSLESDDGRMISTGKSFLEAINVKAKELGLDYEFLYLNDASGNQPVIKSYGKANMARLQKVSRKFDPEQVFQKQVTGGFKLN